MGNPKHTYHIKKQRASINDREIKKLFDCAVERHLDTINKLPYDIMPTVSRQIKDLIYRHKCTNELDRRMELINSSNGLKYLETQLTKESTAIAGSEIAKKYKATFASIDKKKLAKKKKEKAILQVASSAEREGANINTKDYKIVRAKLESNEYWARQVSRIIRTTKEHVLQSLKAVSPYKANYVSDNGMIYQKHRLSANKSILNRANVINTDTGEVISMLDIAMGAVRGRFARLLNWTDGMEEYSQRHGHHCAMYTITCPSRMHPNSDKFDGTTTPQAQKYLSDLWGRTNAILKKRGMYPYGIRVAEPHKDGAVHWHVMLFSELQVLEEISDIIRKQALKEDGNEKGASKHRYKYKEIKEYDKNGNKAKASSYLFKYLFKGLGGDQEQENLSVEKITQVVDGNITRVKAWARQHGIRQIQIVGAPSIGVWDSFRSLGFAPLRYTDSRLWEISDACREGRFADYFEAQGGHTVSKTKHYIQTLSGFVDKQGNILNGGKLIKKKDSRVNKYGEPIDKNIGIVINDIENDELKPLVFPETGWVIDWGS